jgi:hypothetical protein
MCYVTSEQRSQKAKEPRPEGLRLFWAAPLLLVSQRPLRVFSFLAPRCSPKSNRNAALPYFEDTP